MNLLIEILMLLVWNTLAMVVLITGWVSIIFLVGLVVLPLASIFEGEL